MGDRALSYSVLIIAHVFFANVLLMNYLIAILSTTYENMKQSGIFRYKVNLYKYCERFMIAFNNESYGELVLHPPPVSYLCIVMLPFLFSKNMMVKVSSYFSYGMFWLENTLLISAFFMLEVVICPLVYIKVWINILRNSIGAVKTLINSAVWTLIGVPMTLYLIFRDCSFMVHILQCH